MQRSRVLSAVEAIAASIATGADELVALRSAGFDPAEARVVADILPEAFALPSMETLGVGVLAEASVKDSMGQWTEIVLTDSPFFQSALNLAREHRAVGAMPHDAYRAIAERSCLVDAVSKALNAGAEIKGAALSISLLGARAEDFPPPFVLRSF